MNTGKMTNQELLDAFPLSELPAQREIEKAILERMGVDVPIRVSSKALSLAAAILEGQPASEDSAAAAELAAGVRAVGAGIRQGLHLTSTDTFAEAFKGMQVAAFENSKAHGFHPDGEEKNFGEQISLMHSELSEALEAFRHGNPASDHIPEFSGVEEELADVVIRAMDCAQLRGYRLAEAIEAKHAFNVTREFKHGGKKF
jgi:NTP pyrophosphatase (non-canonical NTP hydrolase)